MSSTGWASGPAGLWEPASESPPRHLEQGGAYERLFADLARRSGASSQTLARVFRQIAVSSHTGSPRARSDVSDSLGLSRATVGKAVAALLDHELVVEDAPVVAGRGSPLVPLRLSDSWITIGMRIGHREGHPASITAVALTLNGETLLTAPPVPIEPGARQQDVLAISERLYRHILTNPKVKTTTRGGRRVLGLGIELGGHVYKSHVIYSTNNHWSDFPLGAQLADRLEIPVVVENDVNALVQDALWHGRYPETHFAVIAVYEEGVGGGIAIRGRLQRGGHGLCGEIGHFQAEYPNQTNTTSPNAASDQTGFEAPCPCGSTGHLDALATPGRLRAAIGCHSLDEAAHRKASDLETAAAFARSGRALGRAITAILLLTNPLRVVIRVPPALWQTTPGTAGAQYRRTASETIETGTFSTSTTDAQITWECHDPTDTEKTATKAAATCVLDHFYAHGTNKDCENC